MLTSLLCYLQPNKARLLRAKQSVSRRVIFAAFRQNPCRISVIGYKRNVSSPVIHDLQQNETRGRKRVFWSWVCGDPSLLRDSIHDVHGYPELLHKSEIFSSLEAYCNCRVSSCSLAPSVVPVRSRLPAYTMIGSTYPFKSGITGIGALN